MSKLIEKGMMYFRHVHSVPDLLFYSSEDVPESGGSFIANSIAAINGHNLAAASQQLMPQVVDCYSRQDDYYFQPADDGRIERVFRIWINPDDTKFHSLKHLMELVHDSDLPNAEKLRLEAIYTKVSG